MDRSALALGLSLGLATLVLAPWPLEAQRRRRRENQPPSRPAGREGCKTKITYTGQIKTWVCKTEQPCCVWHEFSYVKCGSTITGCL